MPVVWTISRSLDDQNTYVVAYTNALSGNNLTCCIHQVAAGTTVWHALRKLAFVLSRFETMQSIPKVYFGKTRQLNVML